MQTWPPLGAPVRAACRVLVIVAAPAGAAAVCLCDALEAAGVTVAVQFGVGGVLNGWSATPPHAVVVDGAIPDEARVALYRELLAMQALPVVVLLHSAGAAERLAPIPGLICLPSAGGATVGRLAALLAGASLPANVRSWLDLIPWPPSLEARGEIGEASEPWKGNASAPSLQSLPRAERGARSGRRPGTGLSVSETEYTGRDGNGEASGRPRHKRRRVSPARGVRPAGRHRRWLARAAVAAGLAAALASAGPAIDRVGSWLPTPSAVEAQPALPTVVPAQPRATVQRGTITGVLRATGKIEGGPDTVASFAISGRLQRVLAGVGDPVEAGQPIAELEQDELRQRVEDAASEVRILSLRLEQVRSRTVSDHDVTLARANVDRASAELRRAQELRDQLTAPPAAASVRSADQQVALTAAALEAARARLERALRPPDAAALAPYVRAVEETSLALKRAELDYGAARGRSADNLSPEAVALARARLDYQSAVAALQARRQAQPLDEALLRATLSAQVQAAANEVERAEIALRQADWRVANPPPPQTIDGRPVPVDPSAAPEAANVARAALALARQNLEVARLRERQALAARAADNVTDQAAQRATAEELQRAVEKMKLALDDAEAVYRAAAARASHGLTDQDLELARARLAHERAVQDLETRRAGTAPEEIEALQREVALAEIAHEVALAARRDLDAPPAPAQLAAAEQAIAAATANLDLARADLDAKQSAVAARQDELRFEVRVLEEQVARGRAKLRAAEEALANATLRAPVTGVVVSVERKARDVVEPGAPVLLIADPAQFVAAVSFAESDLQGVSLGARGTMSSPSLPNRRFAGVVAGIDRDGGSGRTVLKLEEPPAGLRAGLPVEVELEDVTREGALIVPARAIRTIGTRRSVTLVADRERDVEVKLGLSSGDMVEVIGPLREGDVVLLYGEAPR